MRGVTRCSKLTSAAARAGKTHQKASILPKPGRAGSTPMPAPAAISPMAATPGHPIRRRAKVDRDWGRLIFRRGTNSLLSGGELEGGKPAIGTAATTVGCRDEPPGILARAVSAITGGNPPTVDVPASAHRHGDGERCAPHDARSGRLFLQWDVT